LVLVALLVSVVVPASAAGQEPPPDNEVTFVAGALRYTGGIEANDVAVESSDEAVVLSDLGADIEAGTGCTAQDGTTHVVTCAVADGATMTSLVVLLGGGDDAFRVDASSGPALMLQVSGEGDDDTLSGGPGSDRLDGGPGSDTVRGLGGADTIDGGTGADTLDGGAHPTMGGLDEVTYASRTSPVAIDLGAGTGGNADDGAGDELEGFEWASGGYGDDELTGSDGDEALDGAAGEDVLRGLGGADALRGDRDLLDTTAYADVLEGGTGTDFLAGGPGPDVLDGGGDRDTVSYFDHGPATFGAPVTAEHAVTVDLGDAGTDGGPLDERSGSPGVRDTLTAIEDVTGGPGDDVLTGDGGANQLLGGGPSPLTPAGAANDGGDDVLTGGGGADRLGGGAMFAGAMVSDGADTYSGGAGNDQIDARDNAADTNIDCGADADQLGSDVNDPPATGCEGALGGPVGPGDPGTLPTKGEVKVAPFGGVGSPTLTYMARDGVANDVTVTNVTTPATKLVVEDAGTGANLTAGAGCTAISASKVECPYSGPLSAIQVGLGDGDDEAAVDIGSLPTGGSVSGDQGDDVITFAGANSLMSLSGGAGADTLTAGAGEDTLTGGPGADVIDGGGGRDIVSYLDGRAGGVVVDLADPGTDGGAEDGPSGARDALTGIEDVRGTLADDTLTGDGGANQLIGLEGGDTISGGAGNDDLDGGLWFHAPFGPSPDGVDTVSGGTGDDRIAGGASADLLHGGDGLDTVSYNDGFRTSGVEVDLSSQGASGTHGGTPDGAGDRIDGFENIEGSPHDDDLSGDGGANTISGSSGGDVIGGGAGTDLLEGGNDTVHDDIDGEGGNDTIVAGTSFTFDGSSYVIGHDGGDAIAGGSGQDTLAYARSSDPVVVTAGAGTGDDGRAGEGDDVAADVENLVGGAGADSLTSTPGAVASRLDGGSGNDELHAGAGDDRLNGGVGFGLATSGDDVLDAGAGDDVLVGGPGGIAPDGDGDDTFLAGTGADLINARDGRADTVITCTDGGDTVVRDASDGTGCAGAGTGAPPATATGTVPAGGTVSTDDGQPGATGADTGVQTPVAGTITIDQTPKVTFTAPDADDVELLPFEAQIEAPQATAGAPLRITFTLDGGLLPAGADLSKIVVYRDGAKVAGCTAGGGATTAAPDPCHLPPVQLAGGDVAITVLSAHASRWNLGVASTTTDPGDGGNPGGGNPGGGNPGGDPGGGGSGGGGTGSGGGTGTGTGTTGGGSTGTGAAPVVPGPTLLPSPVRPRDTAKPKVALGAAGSVTSTALASGGVTATVRCNENAQVTATLTLDARTAKKAKVKGALGTAKAACVAGRVLAIRVRVAGKHRFKVRRLRSGKLTLAVAGVDGAGNAGTAKRSIRIKR
jgi:Ca2+-binding RTX toxin-like protein